MPFRIQEPSHNRYIIDKSPDVAVRSEYSPATTSVYSMPVESRYQLTSEETARDTRRDRNRSLQLKPRRPSIYSVESASSEVGPRYAEEYEEARGPVYDRYARRRTVTETPETLREAFKKLEEKAENSEEVGNYDLKTLATIIKSLRSETREVDEISNEIIDGRKEKGEGLGRRSSVVQQIMSVKPQGSSAPRGRGYLDQGLVRKETRFEAKEHLIKLLEELDKLEEINKVQMALNPEDDNTQYYILIRELADGVKSMRYKARQAIRELQHQL